MIVIYVYLPILVTFLASLIKPMYIDRYLFFAALGLPIIFAIALGQLAQYQRYLATVMVLLLVVGGGWAIYPRPASNNIEVLTNYFKQNSRPGDIIISEGLYWYYTLDYYNRTGIRPLIYPVRWNDGSSGCPSAFGGNTLIYENRYEVYVYDLSKVKSDSGHVWWLNSIGQTEAAPDLPAYWKESGLVQAGNMQLRKYEVREPQNVYSQRSPQGPCSRLQVLN